MSLPRTRFFLHLDRKEDEISKSFFSLFCPTVDQSAIFLLISSLCGLWNCVCQIRFINEFELIEREINKNREDNAPSYPHFMVTFSYSQSLNRSIWLERWESSLMTLKRSGNNELTKSQPMEWSNKN